MLYIGCFFPDEHCINPYDQPPTGFSSTVHAAEMW